MTDKPTGGVIPFQPRSGSEMDDVEAIARAERDAVMATLSNMLASQQQFEGQMKLAIDIIGELQSHVRDLEHDVARLMKERGKTPVILNAQGARAN
jgi:hypothetical protein